MFNLKEFLRPSTGAPALNALFAPHCFVNDNVFITKSNALCLLFEVRGIDDECASDEDLDTQGKRIQNSLKQFDESYTLYQYLIKDDAEPLAVLDQSGQADAVIETADRRRAFLEAKGLYSVRIVYAVLLDNATTRVKLAQTVPGGSGRITKTKLGNDLALLLSQAESFKQAVDDVLHPRLLNNFEVFSFLRFLTSLNRGVADSERLKYDAHVDYFMANTPITFERERGTWRLSVNESPVEVLTVKESPAETMPSVLRSLLAIAGKFVLCAQFKRVPNQDAIAEILKGKGYFSRASKNQTKSAFLQKSVKPEEKSEEARDEGAEDDSAEMGEIRRRLNKGEYFLMYSLTCVLFGQPDRPRLNATVAQFAKAFGAMEASTIRETFDALAAYLAIIPGNTVFDLRRNWELSGNVADMALTTAPSTGWPEEKSVVTVTTVQQTAFHLDLKYQVPTEGRDHGVIGLMAFGERGAGKSVFGSMLIDHAQKRKPKTFVMHLGNSYREVTRKNHGIYAEMRFGDGRQTFRINPFVLPGTDENKSFLVQFVKALLAESGYECDGDDGEHIFNTISTVYRWEPRDRRLGLFAEGLRPGIKKAMRPWVGNGQFAPVFDNEVDTLTFCDFQTFDFQGMDRKYPQVLEPLLFYIFQRISEMVTDPRFAMTEKYLWLDEGWKFLMNKTTREYFIEAAKTWRHYNAGVGILTQSAADLQGPGVFDALSELCPVKVLLASPGAKVSTYRDLFKLNERTAEIFAGLIPRRQALVGTPAGWKRVEILLDEQAIAEYGSAPAEVLARNAERSESGRELETVMSAGA